MPKLLLDVEPISIDILEALNNINCGFLGRDRFAKVAFANDRLLLWLGYTIEEIRGEPLTMLFPPELRDRVEEELQIPGGDDIRARLTVLQRKDSTTMPVVVLPHRLLDEQGEVTGGIAVIVDLGAVQTAKDIGYSTDSELRSRLSRIALELQSLGLAAGAATGEPAPLHHPALAELSPREQEILAALVAGDRVPTIAKRLHISPHTVRNHLKSTYRKLDVGSQAELLERVRSLGGDH